MKKIVILSLLSSHLFLSNNISAEELDNYSLPNDVPTELNVLSEESSEISIKENQGKEEDQGLVVIEKEYKEVIEKLPESPNSENVEKINQSNQTNLVDNNQKDTFEEVVDLDNQPVYINDTDRILSIYDGVVKLQTDNGVIEKTVKEIGGKKLPNGKHEIIDKTGKKLILPKMNSRNSSYLSIYGIVFCHTFFLLKKQFKRN